ncbi:MAG: thioredoxin family protein, partial [Hymenobacter sp.]|nr:thioredoxin family protein [Hymenobacter sp.]
AGYLPPPTSRDFTLAAAPGAAAAAPLPVVAASQASEKPRFGDFLELPLGLPGYFDLAQARRVARQQHKPLFIDFTGHGCVNCRKMEASVWSDPAVLARLRRDYVVVALYVDDKTELPAADWYTSPRDQKVKKSLGQQNADLQLTRYGVNAQPYYVLLDPDQDNPAPLVPPVAYEPGPARFAQFLAAGTQRYHNTPRALAVR